MSSTLPRPFEGADNGPPVRNPLMALLDMQPTRGGEVPRLDRGWLLELATTLQTTLDPQALVELFVERLGSLVPHDGAAFTAPDDGLEVRVGSRAPHRCRYDLTIDRQAVGALTLFRREPFTETETVLIEQAVANLGHPLRNALMYRRALDAATRDPLTGLSNRAALGPALEREVEVSRRHATTLSLIMIDADRFKAINDRYGHPVGDAALREMARVISECIRDSDLAFRYGGEEFCVVLARTDLGGALRVAERIRAGLEQRRIAVPGGEIHLSASLGVARLGPEEDAHRLLEKADAALYRSKRDGRNRVTAERLPAAG